MGTLRILDDLAGSATHDGEIYACSYTADGAYVLSAGWDGHLRLWDATSGSLLSAIPASPKPLSACVCSPDGSQWLAGSMEGLLTTWDGVSHQSIASFMAHTRPISSIDFSPDGKWLVTASWDRQVIVRKTDNHREARILGQHHDIVSGARFSVDGNTVLSWSHDSTIKVWDANTCRELATFAGHSDRVAALALSPDGRMALSGSRDATIRLWDLEEMCELATVNVGAEVRACYFLLDGESVIIADAVGRLFLMTAPTFQVQSEHRIAFKVMCGALSPSGLQLALAGEDGAIRFVDVEGLEESPLIVTAKQSLREEKTLLGRFFGQTKTTRKFAYTCPACRQDIEVDRLPAQPVPCPRCHRTLRVSGRPLVLQA